jgi:hypothetical protein
MGKYYTIVIIVYCHMPCQTKINLKPGDAPRIYLEVFFIVIVVIV